MPLRTYPMYSFSQSRCLFSLYIEHKNIIGQEGYYGKHLLCEIIARYILLYRGNLTLEKSFRAKFMLKGELLPVNHSKSCDQKVT